MEQLSHTTTDTADQADEEIFTFPVSDEALEAAAGTERGGNVFSTYFYHGPTHHTALCC
jgi:hypothetical protein